MDLADLPVSLSGVVVQRGALVEVDGDGKLPGVHLQQGNASTGQDCKSADCFVIEWGSVAKEHWGNCKPPLTLISGGVMGNSLVFWVKSSILSVADITISFMGSPFCGDRQTSYSRVRNSHNVCYNPGRFPEGAEVDQISCKDKEAHNVLHQLSWENLTLLRRGTMRDSRPIKISV